MGLTFLLIIYNVIPVSYIVFVPVSNIVIYI